MREKLYEFVPPSPEHQTILVNIESGQEMEYFQKVDECDAQSLTQALILETSVNVHGRIRDSVTTLFQISVKSTPSFYKATKHRCPMKSGEVTILAKHFLMPQFDQLFLA